MKKNILILGSNGRLGTYLRKYLKERKINFIGHNRKNNDLIFTNFIKQKDIYDYLDFIDPDIIINLIAITSIEYSEKNPSKAFFVNALIPKYISNWVSLHKDKHMIQISTDHVYDNKSKSKESQINLKNVYATTKFLGDLNCSKKNTTILRTNFFDLTSDYSKPSLCDWIYEAVLNKKYVNLYEDVYFNPLHISTLCNYLEKIIRKPLHGTFNIGARDSISKYEFGYRIIKKFNLNTNYIIKSRYTNNNNIYRPLNMRTNVSKFFKTYKPMNIPIIYKEIDKLKI